MTQQTAIYSLLDNPESLSDLMKATGYSREDIIEILEELAKDSERSQTEFTCMSRHPD